MQFPEITPAKRLEMLEPPKGPVSMVLDTDTFNEIDDQFALVFSLLSPRLTVEGVYAAPFFNERSSGPADGMEKSYQEIVRILTLLGRRREGMAFRGSTAYLPEADKPVESDAARDLIARARAQRDEPLYVAAIGACTNVASAILLAPDIIRNIVVVWLGGHPLYWPTTAEFNLQQDLHAARVLFNSGVPLVLVPCKNVAEHLRTTLAEMEAFVKGHGAIGDYLYQTFKDCHNDHFAYSRVIWDISTVAWLNYPNWVKTDLFPSPILHDDLTWGPVDNRRHLVRIATDVRRDAIFRDLFIKLQQH